MKEILERIKAVQANVHGLADPQAAIAALTLEFMTKAAEEIEALKDQRLPKMVPAKKEQDSPAEQSLASSSGPDESAAAAASAGNPDATAEKSAAKSDKKSKSAK